MKKVWYKLQISIRDNIGKNTVFGKYIKQIDITIL